MTMTNANKPRRTRLALGGVVVAAGLALAACGGSSTPSANGASATTAPAGQAKPGPAGRQVLPVTTNPINNPATARTLKIDSVLVENNVDAAGKAVEDHLELALTNSGGSELKGFEAFYTITDPTAGKSESYYADLSGFTIPAGASRTLHFDNTGAAGHFPVNEFSLYSTSVNALDLEVQVSAQGAAVQTATVKKDAGGAEIPD